MINVNKCEYYLVLTTKAIIFASQSRVEEVVIRFGS